MNYIIRLKLLSFTKHNLEKVFLFFTAIFIICYNLEIKDAFQQETQHDIMKHRELLLTLFAQLNKNEITVLYCVYY